MTEQNAPSSDSPAMDSQASLFEAADPAAPSQSKAAQPDPDDDWETVSFPGALPLEAIAAPPPPRDIPKVAEFGPREAELLQLIQDLNQCNDALLARVGALEEALERSESALQIEVERAQHNQSATSAEAQATLAQQQRQVAQLLSELDVANDAVRRTTIHNETLQAELDVTKQRVAQLERECTLLQQRFTEKSGALQQAENTCRDLRSRLQRQQHYTLQFKAALEKCLDMSSHRTASPTVDLPTLVEEPLLRPHPLAMPKAQQIQPWSSNDGSAPPDHSLDTLLRNLKSVGQGPRSPMPSAVRGKPQLPQPIAPTPDPEAETQLWQDLERVIETSTPKADLATPDTVESLPVPPTETAEPTFTEPSPWGAPLPAAAQTSAEPEPASTQVPLAEHLARQLEASHELLSKPASDSAKSPLPPLVQPQAPASSAASTYALPPLLSNASPSASPAPATGQSPSPLVYPLRPQKKLKSIAAVELPTFPRKQRAQ